MGKDWMIRSPKVYQTKEPQELCGELRYWSQGFGIVGKDTKKRVTVSNGKGSVI